MGKPHPSRPTRESKRLSQLPSQAQRPRTPTRLSTSSRTFHRLHPRTEPRPPHPPPINHSLQQRLLNFLRISRPIFRRSLSLSELSKVSPRCCSIAPVALERPLKIVDAIRKFEALCTKLVRATTFKLTTAYSLRFVEVDI
jgi:hypothetical protein